MPHCSSREWRFGLGVTLTCLELALIVCVLFVAGDGNWLESILLCIGIACVMLASGIFTLDSAGSTIRDRYDWALVDLYGLGCPSFYSRLTILAILFIAIAWVKWWLDSSTDKVEMRTCNMNVAAMDALLHFIVPCCSRLSRYQSDSRELSEISDDASE
eukprot:TRINITY_DN44061_c0_g1_i1.p1 TRINITY_DN44061_c0_g1~~TRINITY_DN44061_c0_g1_i1.p1  ORF type:complete len:159 (+),score=19.20 TRINITY_DN44061_c0_g1_i1:80-556(+)